MIEFWTLFTGLVCLALSVVFLRWGDKTFKGSFLDGVIGLVDWLTGPLWNRTRKKTLRAGAWLFAILFLLMGIAFTGAFLYMILYMQG